MGEEATETGSRRGDAGADRYLGSSSRATRQQVQDRRWRLAGIDAYLAWRSKTGMRVGNWVRREVHLSIRVVYGKGSRDMEDKGDGSRKQSNGGTGF